jgi:hypothetical protein
MTHTTTPPTPAVLQQQMLDLIEELRTASSYRRQQRCLAELEVLRYQLHSHPDLLEKLATLLAVTGQALQDPAYSAVMRLAAVTATDWLVGVARAGNGDPQQLATKINRLLHSGVAAHMLIPVTAVALPDEVLRALQQRLWAIELGGKFTDEALLQIAAADNDLIAMAEAIIVIDNPDAWAIDVAERLLEAGQPREVLDWLWGTDVPRHERERRTDLRIAAYEQLGRQRAAQRVRWRWFTRTLSRRHFDDYVAQIPAEERQAVRHRAIRLARTHPKVRQAARFLHGLGERDENAQT